VTVSRANKRYLVTVAMLLLFLLSAGSGAGETMPTGIKVGLNPQKGLWLPVTLQSFAEARITLDKERVPWGSKYSMILVAVTSNGQRLEEYPSFDDPGFEKVSLDPRVSVSGDINLADYFRDLDGVVKKSDVQLFWAYKAPDELHIPHWSGGWILIPQQK
jgi:hypothetical protein